MSNDLPQYSRRNLRFLPWMLGVLVGLGGAHFVWQFTGTTTRSGDPASPPSQAQDSLENARTDLLREKPPSSVSSTDKNPKLRAGIAIKEWKRARGFTTEYNRYFLNESFLRNQALSGDMLAAQLLGYQMLGSEEGDKYLTDAARRGSIQALHFLSASHEARTDGRVDLRANGAAEAHGASALAYLFVAEMRGDNYAAPGSIDRLRKRISYTQEDIRQACHEARTTYSRLEDSRMAEGLGRFDNSVAPGVSRSTRFSQLCG